MSYGQLPEQLGTYIVECNEMMFYQYLPIKLPENVVCKYEQRLKCFSNIISDICQDFIDTFGFKSYQESYVYLTAKHQFQTDNCSFNRPGYHSDGFLTDDINYIWSDCNPTIFNMTAFDLTFDDKKSLIEMNEQALAKNEVFYDDNELLRLDQYCIHKVNDKAFNGMRVFLKISFSKDKYNLIGNSHNYLLDYKWKMKERNADRNIPQSTIS